MSNKYTVQTIANAFGADHEQADVLHKHGVTVVPKANHIEYLYGNELMAAAGIKKAVVTLACDGALGATSVSILKQEVNKTMQKAYDKLMSYQEESAEIFNGPGVALEVEANDDEEGIADVYMAAIAATAIPNEDLKSAKAAENEYKQVFAEAKDAYKNGSPANLIDVTELYQPVHGTSKGSKYYAVAIAAGLKVAARFRPQQVSIRAEGTSLASYKTQLAEAGFTAAGDKHMSAHLDVSDELLQKKTVGALLFATGIEFQQLATNMDPIYGKGV